jgi:hypothetical protein
MISHESIIADLPEFEALGGGSVAERHRRFIQEYVADPKRIAGRAYAKVWARANDATAQVNASVLLRKPKIKAAIRALEGKIRDTALPRILDKLEAIIHSELRDVMTWTEKGQAKLIAADKLSPAASAALAMIQEVREERQPRLPGIDGPEDQAAAAINLIRKSVKMHDPLKAMEIYAKLAGIGAAQRIELAGFGDSVREAWARLEAGAKGEDHAGA